MEHIFQEATGWTGHKGKMESRLYLSFLVRQGNVVEISVFRWNLDSDPLQKKMDHPAEASWQNIRD